MDVVGPEGLKKHVVHDGNMIVSYGCNRLGEMLVSDTDGASAWANYIGVGTGTGAVNFAEASLNAGTAVVTANKSDKGDRTVEYQATFEDGSAYEIHEIGLCETNQFTGGVCARLVLSGTQSVNKGSADTVNFTYQVLLASG